MPRQRPALVQAAIDRVLADVDALPDAALRVLHPELRAAVGEAGRKLDSWLGRQQGQDRFTAAHRRQVLLRMVETLKAVEARLGGATARSLRVGREDGGVSAARNLASEVGAMRRAFAAFPYEAAAPPQISEATVLAKGQTFLVRRHASSASRYGREVALDIRRQITRGVLLHETMDEMTARLIRLGGPRGMVHMGGGRSELISEGLFARYNHWAERLVRTEVMNAYNVQHEIGLRELNRTDPGWLREWDAANDRRLCIICAGLDGKLAEVGEDFPGGFRRAPAHPRCRCVEVAARREWRTPDRA